MSKTGVLCRSEVQPKFKFGISSEKSPVAGARKMVQLGADVSAQPEKIFSVR